MGGYILRRLLESALILLGITLVTFVLLYLVPADPARQIAGRSATAETVANIRDQLGLNDPFFVQYFRYLGNLLQGDLGAPTCNAPRCPSLSPRGFRPACF